MDKNVNILLAGGIIDFYVNKKKFKNYKTKRGQFNYVFRELNKILISMKGETVNGIELRHVTITSNNFWGQDDLCIVNDIGYCNSNILPLNNSIITIRIFSIDLTGLVKKDTDVYDCFFNRRVSSKKMDYLLTTSNCKIV